MKTLLISEECQLIQRAMAGSYAYFPKALLRLSPSDVMTRLWVILYR